jgi:hypothetical protein
MNEPSSEARSAFTSPYPETVISTGGGVFAAAVEKPAFLPRPPALSVLLQRHHLLRLPTHNRNGPIAEVLNRLQLPRRITSRECRHLFAQLVVDRPDPLCRRRRSNPDKDLPPVRLAPLPPRQPAFSSRSIAAVIAPVVSRRPRTDKVIALGRRNGRYKEKVLALAFWIQQQMIRIFVPLTRAKNQDWLLSYKVE